MVKQEAQEQTLTSPNDVAMMMKPMNFVTRVTSNQSTKHSHLKPCAAHPHIELLLHFIMMKT